jgi:hypothetical protein
LVAGRLHTLSDNHERSITPEVDEEPAKRILNLATLAVLAVVIVRAHSQAITIDEATTYDLWIAPSEPDYWQGASNNHILNSILTRLCVLVFGLSHLTMRCGAIAGALLYLSAVRAFCLRLPSPLQYAAFICLTANPFLLDYLVAARGYGLALGFLAWLPLIPLLSRSTPPPRDVSPFVRYSPRCAPPRISHSPSWRPWRCWRVLDGCSRCSGFR